MSNFKTLIIAVALALLAGVLGGFFASYWFMRQRKESDVVRARRFDVVSANGTVRATLALNGGEVPTLALYAPDGKERVSLSLDNIDEALLMMSDRKGDIRAYFGHETSDTASPSDDDWVLSFRSFGDEEPKASIGMFKSYPSRKHIGFVDVRGEKGQRCGKLDCSR